MAKDLNIKMLLSRSIELLLVASIIFNTAPLIATFIWETTRICLPKFNKASTSKPNEIFCVPGGSQIVVITIPNKKGIILACDVFFFLEREFEVK